MADNLKKTMRAVQMEGPVRARMEEWTKELLEENVKVSEIPIPVPKNGEVLIKMEKAAINPSDLSTLKGTYGHKLQYPTGVGFEGCGTVVASGGGFMGWRLVGKRVALSATNLWAEYTVAPATRCVEIGDTPFELATSVFVNPMTVLAFIEIAQAENQRFLVHTAAASALGQMLIRFGKRNGIGIICVVRSAEQEKICRDNGAEYVVNLKDEDFISKLREITLKTNCTLGFDAVAGDLTGQILDAMPDGSTVQVYGGLSEKACTASPRDFIFKKKKLIGFWLTDYIKTKWTVGLLQWTRTIVSHLATDFKTDIALEVPLTQIWDGLLRRSGKVVVQCNLDKISEKS